jgi:hypothetical protein
VGLLPVKKEPTGKNEATKRRIGPVTDSLEKLNITPEASSKTIGYGYSRIAKSILDNMTQPIPNSDKFRRHYAEMIQEDETIGTGLDYLSGRVLSKIGTYVHQDERIKEFVDDCIENIHGTMKQSRKSLIYNAFGFGYGVGEYTVTPHEGQWRLSSLSVYDPLSLSFIPKKREDGSYTIGTVVQKVSGSEDIKIPAEKCVIFTNGNSSTPYGNPLLRRCYRWWIFKKAIPLLWSVSLERFGTPILYGKANTPALVEHMSEAFENLASKAYLITDTSSDISAIQGLTGGGEFAVADELCDKKIYRALYLPSLLASGENGGSYALGGIHLELFDYQTTTYAEEYKEIELEQLWRPLIEFNFGPQDDYGDFTINDSMPMDEKLKMASLATALSSSGMLEPKDDMNVFREAFGLKKLEEEDLTAWLLKQEEKENQDQARQISAQNRRPGQNNNAAQ